MVNLKIKNSSFYIDQQLGVRKYNGKKNIQTTRTKINMNTLNRNVWTLYKGHQEFYQSKRNREQRKEHSMVSVLEKKIIIIL